MPEYALCLLHEKFVIIHYANIEDKICISTIVKCKLNVL